MADSYTTDETDIMFLVRGICCVCSRRIYQNQDAHSIGPDGLMICSWCWGSDY
jgi:hypothetical protein